MVHGLRPSVASHLKIKSKFDKCCMPQIKQLHVPSDYNFYFSVKVEISNQRGNVEIKKKQIRQI